MRATNERTALLLTVALFCLTCTASGCTAKKPKPNYIGCYQDSKSSRDLPQTISGQEPMTLAVCESRCRGLGRKYLALQGGDECWCGDSYGKYGKMEEGGCNRACAGQVEQMCGGVVANAVYEIAY